LLSKDPTDKYQKLAQKTLQKCKLILDKQKKKSSPKESFTSNTKSTIEIT